MDLERKRILIMKRIALFELIMRYADKESLSDNELAYILSDIYSVFVKTVLHEHC